jgi:hypothetical protein
MDTQVTTSERRRSRLAILVAAVAALGISFTLMIQPALATHVAPILFQDNPTCGQLGEYDHEFKVEPVTAGLHEDPNSDFSVTLTLNATADGQTFDFVANIGVDAVFAKGGPGGNLYVYDPAATADTGLHAPGNDGGTAVVDPPWSGLSHISFCFNDVPEETPTPTPTPTPTTEGTVRAGNPTPEASQPDTAMGAQGGPSPVPTAAFALILLAALGTLAWANVKTARNRG